MCAVSCLRIGLLQMFVRGWWYQKGTERSLKACYTLDDDFYGLTNRIRKSMLLIMIHLSASVCSMKHLVCKKNMSVIVYSLRVTNLQEHCEWHGQGSNWLDSNKLFAMATKLKLLLLATSNIIIQNLRKM